MSHPRSDVFIFFGATGDLAFKEIFPALFLLFRRGKLQVSVIGVARTELTNLDFHKRAEESLRAARISFSRQEFNSFAAKLRYLPGDYKEPTTFQRLDRELEGSARPLFYMAIPPRMFDVVITGIKSIRCGPAARIVVEKPFGRDLASARALNQTLHHCFPEESVFRLDHFLAMETVENLVYFRFSNMFLHPLWNHHYIKNIQITMAENFGVAGRGAFYDDVGCVRDVVQNHLFQILGLLAMNMPVDLLSADAYHQEQLNTFRDITPLERADVVFGQFAGYRAEAGVDPQSNTETYVAIRLEINNDRWRGVPFYIRTGKCLPSTCTEVMVTLNAAALSNSGLSDPPLPNYLRFRLHPEMEIAIGAQIKRPGRQMSGELIELMAQREEPGGIGAYERLLGDSIEGDDSLFTRIENVEAAWAIVENILDSDNPVCIYEPGSWGPLNSQDVLINGDEWHTPGGMQALTATAAEGK